MVDPPGVRHRRAKRGLWGFFKKPTASLPVGVGPTGVLDTVDQPAVYHDRAKGFSRKLLKKRRSTQDESYKYQPSSGYDYDYDGWDSEGGGKDTSWNWQLTCENQ
jgi:hypothetical protein